MVSVWPNIAADAMPVKMVATVDEYFFKIVSEHNKWSIWVIKHKTNYCVLVNKAKDDNQTTLNNFDCFPTS